MSKLHDIPRGSRIRVKASIGGAPESDEIIVFHKIDGAYSFCTIEGKPEAGACHLSACTPLRLMDDGTYEISEGGTNA